MSGKVEPWGGRALPRCRWALGRRAPPLPVPMQRAAASSEL